MNLRTTLVLIVLGIAGGAVYLVGPRLPRAIYPRPAEEPAADLGTIKKLEELKPGDVTAVSIKPARGPALEFKRTKGEWTLPGNWPTRQTEAEALITRLCSLRSRFAPLPIDKDEDLKAYGLDQPEYAITIETAGSKILLSLGEAEARENSFFRPVYARLGETKEAVRLAPGTLSALGRPADFYQKRQLFPAVREARSEGSGDRTERLDAVSVEARGPEGTSYTVSKTEHGWRLSSPSVERIDPDKANQLREAAADLWAERFVSSSPADAAAMFDIPLTAGGGLAPALAVGALAPSRDAFLARAGLVKPERTLTVTTAAGTTKLLIGGLAGTRTKVRPPPPGPPGQPPMPQITTEEMRFARIENNDQVFEIKADKLKDLFVSASSLRNMRLARFEKINVRRVEVFLDSVKAAVLFRGDKENDPWRLETPSEASKDASMLAEESKVTELLDKLSGMSGQDKETDRPAFGASLPGLGAGPGAALNAAASLSPGSLRGQASAGAFAKPLATVKVSLAEGKDKKTITKEITLTIGEQDTVNKLLLVKVDDWPRVEMVEDALLALVKRPSLAYRGKLFDFAADDVKQLSVEQDGKTIRFTQADKKWRMALPAAADADAVKVGALLTTLTKLEPVEYVAENASPDDLDAKYGLVKPVLGVTLNAGTQSKTLWLGKKRGDKAEYYARLHGNFSVFVVAGDLHASLIAASLSYLPLQLWTAEADKVEGLRIEKEGGEPFELERKDKSWKLTKPVSTAASEAAVRSLLDTAAGPFADRYEAHNSPDPAKFGFDKPYLKVKLTLGQGAARELTIGKPVSKDSTDRYAKTSDNTAVSVLRGDVVKGFERGSLDLIDTLLLSVNLDAIQSIQSDSGAKFVLKPAGKTWKVEEAPGSPYTADENAITALGGILFNLRAERYAVYGANLDLPKHGLDKPFATLTLAIKEGEGKTRQRVLSVGGEVSGSPGQRYIRVDQANGIAILSSNDTRTLTRTNLDYVDHRMLKLAPEKVTSFQRVQGMETLEIAKQDDEWQILKPQAQRAEDKAAADLLRILSDLRASRVAEYPLKDPKKFGLDEPTLTLTLKLTGPDGKPAQHVLALGAEVKETPGERYAKIDAIPAVYVLNAAAVRAVQASGLTFRTRLLARFSDADKILLERGPRQAAFGRVGGSWAMTAPIEAKAENDPVEDFLNKAAKLEADELIADKPTDLKPYGLDKPTVRWRFQADGKDVLDLVVGKLDAGGKRAYAKLGTGTLVFLLSPEMTKSALGEFRERTIFTQPLDAAQADTLKLTQGGKMVILKKTGATWAVEGKPDTPLMVDTVNDTLAALAGLKLERYAVDKSADRKLFGLDPPELVLEAEAGEKKTVLHIGRFEGDSKRVYAAVPEKDRTEVYVLSEADTARLTRDVAAFGKPLPKKEPTSPIAP